MDLDRFDNLTRQLATGTSRRQVLKGILTFAVGSILSQFGLKAYADDGVETLPAQGDDQLFLPRIIHTCLKASVYGDPVPCGPSDLGCRCVRTREGDIRCGIAPCSARECSASSDCADLGPNYFCDVPNSGNCDDPPTPPRSRCLAPCGYTYCPETTTSCGTKCCTADQTCSEDKCISTYRCEISHVTIADMRAAVAALKAGETRVNLTPEGCIWYTQELDENDNVIARSMFIAEVEVSQWKREGNVFTQQSDSDRDGFFEWRSVTTEGSNANDFTTVETEYSPETQKLFRRTTLTPQGELTRLVVEEDIAGKMEVVDDYTVPRVQGAKLTGDNLPDELTLDSILADCKGPPCSSQEVLSRMEESVDRGLQCFDDMGDPGLNLYEKALNVIGRQINVTCAPIANFDATLEGWENPDGPLNLTVDPAKYCNMDGEQRSWILFHEILHAAMQRPHDPAAEQLEEAHRMQMDRIYGCMGFCYNRAARPTKCMCAKCFNVKTCDPLCARATSDCGAKCPCVEDPSRYGKYYERCDQCLSSCPSGLTCKGYRTCDPVGHSPNCPPVTCP